MEQRVIIVDDELLFQGYLAKHIGKFPNVEIAAKFENGFQAQRFLENNKDISIAFVDILMPVMDGLALAQWISAHSPGTKVVLISAHQDFEYAQKAIRANVYHYLSKPLKFEELEAVFTDIEAERKTQEKARLFVRDLNSKRADLELYHSVLDGEKVLYRTDWSMKIEDETTDELAGEMLITGIRNVIRYCSPSVAAVVSNKNNIIKVILLAADESQIPTVECFLEKASELMDTSFHISILYSGQSDKKDGDINQTADGDVEIGRAHV